MGTVAYDYGSMLITGIPHQVVSERYSSLGINCGRSPPTSICLHTTGSSSNHLHEDDCHSRCIAECTEMVMEGVMW